MEVVLCEEAGGDVRTDAEEGLESFLPGVRRAIEDGGDGELK